MNPPAPYAAFFDLDDTLLSKNSGKVFWDYCFANRVYTLEQLGFLGLSLVRFLSGFDEAEEFVRNWAQCFRGWPESKLEQITRELFEKEIRHLIREDAKHEIRRHQSQGARTVILSASTRFVCEPVREHLQIDHVLCTGLEVKDGRLTGNFSSPYVFGEQKYLSALAYCQEHQLDLATCYYYGDAYTDRFVMEAVGNPVCVSPDRQLRGYAARKGWKIVEW